MFSSGTLDIAISLVLVFLLVSIMLTALIEVIEARLKTRAVDLERAIGQIFADPGGAANLVSAFYNHPLVFALYDGPYVAAKGSGLTRRGGNLPSYIPRDLFSSAALDLAAGTAGNARMAEIVANLGSSLNLAERKAKLESWYDGVMDRVAGQYKRRTQKRLLWLGFVVAIAFNVNPFAISQYLAQNSEARAQLVEVAQRVQHDNAATSTEDAGVNPPPARQAGGEPAAETGLCLETAQSWTDAARCQRAIADVGIPIGWSSLSLAKTFPHYTGVVPGGLGLAWLLGDALLALIGFGITALAATLGAPFWFDVLNKIMVVRSTVKPKEKSRDEASEDRSAGTAAAKLPANAGIAGNAGMVQAPVANDGAVG